jgi:hypothetical protein
MAFRLETAAAATTLTELMERHMSHGVGPLEIVLAAATLMGV